MHKFTLLMCIYAKENPVFLTQCIKSVMNQTVIPDEWIIVKDGPLTNELEAVLSNITYPGIIKQIALPQNVTLGPARAIGVEEANNDWIAIMDCDDICRHDRFEKQLAMIGFNPDFGLIGGQIAEFIEDPGHVIAKRNVPTEQIDIIKYAKRRNPYNHMTVMFKRELAIQVGNYRYFPGFEDYDLWTRMMRNGVICANHPDILVDARVGSGVYGRRRGVSYIKSEWRMQKQLKKLGITNAMEFMRNCAVRIPVRLLPERALEAAYNRYAR